MAHRPESAETLPTVAPGTYLGHDIRRPDIASPHGSMVGRIIGSYRLTEELGRGGMGLIYKAVRNDGELHMTAAVKLIRSEILETESIRRFRQERQLLANLRHPHIAPLLDAGTTEDNLPYFIMDLVEGKDIATWARDTKPELSSLLQIFRKVLDALSHAHRKGVIHRDIKPANILVTPEGEPLLLDFGIAQSIQQDRPGEGIPVTAMTPAYASPEQLSGGPVSPQFDIYAMGLLLLELLRGERFLRAVQKPEDWLKAGHLRHLVSDTTFTDTESLNTTTTRLEDILLATLAEDPQRRYDTCEAMLGDLDQLLADLVSHQSTQHIKRPAHGLIVSQPADEELAETLTKHLEGNDLKLELLSDPNAFHLIGQKFAGIQNCLLLWGQKSPVLDDHLRDHLSQRYRLGQLRIIPIVLPGGLRPTKESDLPRFLRRKVWWDFSKGWLANKTLAQLAHYIYQDEKGPTTGNEPQVCPFRGLESFREEDRRFFFGREILAEKLIHHMTNQRFLAVLGASGSGKSSVVQAGLIPYLRERGDHLLTFTPTATPLQELAQHVRTLYGGLRIELPDTEQLFRRLKMDERALHFILEEVAEADGPDYICLVIDQFEEIFTLAKDQEQKLAFINSIIYALDNHKNFSVVLTIRSDFMGKCAIHPDLMSYVTEKMVAVLPMTRQESLSAIQEPARLVGLRFEHGLLDKILDDLTHQAVPLPQMEHALLELYNRRHGNLLTASAYNQIGGLEGAIARRAESTYESLDAQGKETLRKMFTHCLVTPGEGAEDTRRRASRKELIDVGMDQTQSEALLNKLIDMRLLTGHRDPFHNEEKVDVAHEALIRKWDRIKTWMDEDREVVRQILHLRRRATAWEEAGRHGAYLLRGPLLVKMGELLKREGTNLGSLEVRYIKACQHRKKTKKLRRRLAFASVLGLSLLFSMGLLWHNRNLQRQKQLTEEQRDVAQQVTKFFTDLILAADPYREKGFDLRIGEVFKEARTQLTTDLKEAHHQGARAQVLLRLMDFHRRLGAHDIALEYARERLAFFRKTPDDAYNIIYSLEDVSEILRLLGRFDEALIPAKEGFELARAHFPDGEPYAMMCNLMGIINHQKGELQSAREYMDKARDYAEKHLGMAHENTAAVNENIGYLLKEMGLMDEAYAYMTRALDIRHRMFGDKLHPDIAHSHNSIGLLFLENERYDEARTHLEKSLEINRFILGDKHVNISFNLNNLAQLEYSLGAYDKALSQFKEAEVIKRATFKAAQPSLALTLGNLGALYLHAFNDIESAQPYLEEALDFYTQTHGPNHRRTTGVRLNYAHLLITTQDYKLAKVHAEKSVSALGSVLAEDHHERAIAKSVQGWVMVKQGNEDGLRLLKEAYDGLVSKKGAGNIAYTLPALRRLIDAYHHLDRQTEGVVYQQLLNANFR